jgi:surface protein
MRFIKLFVVLALGYAPLLHAVPTISSQIGYLSGVSTTVGSTTVYHAVGQHVGVYQGGTPVVVPSLLGLALSSGYSVTYNANEATGGDVPDAQVKGHDVALTLATNSGNLVRTGYAFDGWNTQADGLGDAYAAGASYTENVEVELFAQWAINQYTITFDSAGGSVVAPMTQDFGTAVTAPANPSKTGYFFAGWEPVLPENMPASNATHVAQWKVPMTLVFDTAPTAGRSIAIPLHGTVNVTVDWGDGSTPEVFTTPGSKFHTYASDGEYTVTISGALDRFGDQNNTYPYPYHLSRVASFGDIGITSLSGAFRGASHLTSVPTILPAAVTDLSYVFKGATNFNHNIGSWDVSNVTNMVEMFSSATVFNQDISGWVVSNATQMAGMFEYARAFNQDISGWEFPGVASLSRMFWNASAFNQDIGSWDVSSVTSLHEMFRGATSFDQNIGGWVVSNVTQMSGMFQGVTLSTANYDALLTGWSAQAVQTFRTFHGGNSMYTAAAARAILTGAFPTGKNWTITDGGLVSYPVTYNANGSTGGDVPGPQAKGHGVALTLATSGNLVRTGYTFAGWNTQADGLGDAYAAGASYTANVAVELFAQWVGLVPDIGPLAGGNSVVLTNTVGSITNVVFGGNAATLTGSGADWVAVTVPPAASAGVATVTLQRDGQADITLANAYTYNPAGVIRGTSAGPHSWTNLSTGMNGTVSVLAHDGTNLYAGGDFTDAGLRVTKWDAAAGAWTNLAGGMNASVLALAHDGENLYAGGSFTNAGGVAANQVAMWDASSGSWTNLAGGMNAFVRALAHDGTNLYAGGSFTNAGGVAANRVAMWDAASGSWTNLAGGMNNTVRAFAHDGTNLYAGGEFTNAGGVAANRVAMWDAASGSWTNLADGIMDGIVWALVHDGENLYAGGSFTIAGGSAGNRVAMWDAAAGAWTNLSSGMSSTVYALAHDGENLYAGGGFMTAGGIAANRVAMWDAVSGSWTNLAGGMNQTVWALAHDGENLYAGGAFTNAGGVAANRVAKWGPSIIETAGVEPGSGSWTGGYEVVISGANLGDGVVGDIEWVTLAGVTAAVQSVSGSTQLVVVAGASSSELLGDVRVYSTSHGETVRSNAFTYTASELGVIGTNGVAVTNAQPASLVSGTDLGTLSWSLSVTNTLVVTNAGSAELVVSGVATNGADPGAFALSPTAFTLPVGGVTNVAVVFAPTAAGNYAATFRFAYNSPAGFFDLPVAGEGLKRDQAITFGNPGAQLTTNTVGLVATASSGLPVSFVVAGGQGSIAGGTNLTFTGAGNVSIVASQAGSANYQVAAPVTNTFHVIKATALVTLTNLVQVYDGGAKSPTSQTSPTGLTVDLTYDGGANVPVNAGTYLVEAAIDESMYQGSAAELFTIQKAPQTINDFLPADAAAFAVQDTPGVSATASSTLPVSFAVVGGPGNLTGGTNLTFTGLGDVLVRATQGGNTNWLAVSATNTYTVAGGLLDVLGANGVLIASEAAPSVPRGTAFGIVFTNEVASSMLSITNAGNAALQITGVTTNGSEYFAITGMPQTVAAGTVSNFWVGYMPGASGAHQATFTIESDGLPATFDLRVAGTGIRPGEIWLDKAYLGYESYFGGPDPAVDTYLITNRGESAFSYTNEIAYGSGAINWFSVDPLDGALDPAGLQWHTGTVSIAGIDAGRYLATNTITGTATNAPIDMIVELMINRAPQTIAFAAIGDQIATNALVLSATASPSGLPVAFRVEEGAGVITTGTNLTFTGTGVVSVVASQVGSSNYLAAVEVTNSFTVAKADALVVLSNLEQTYDGQAKSPTIQTSPTGLTVRVTYDGSYTAPKNVGSYAIVATIDAPLYQGSATGTLGIGRSPADVHLNGLSQIYDGTARTVTATTAPLGLQVDITYNGDAWAPTNAGSYGVVATISDADYQGVGTGTLVVAKAAQTITFAPLAPQRETATNALSATASSALPVMFAVEAGPGVVGSDGTNGTYMTYVGPGEVVVVASQAGDDNYAAAPSVTNVVKVFRTTPWHGPYAGGNVVVVTNGFFGAITNVLVGDLIDVVDLIDSGTNWFAIRMPAATNAGWADIVVQTASNGTTVLPDAYRYNAAGVITNVSPATGTWQGGYQVVISGTDLTDPTDLSDITGVMLSGVTAAVQSVSGSTQLVVVAGASSSGVVGDVRVYSTSFGETVKTNAFEYLRTEQAALWFMPTSPQAYNTTNVLTTTGGSGTGVVSYVVQSGPGTIVGSTNLYVSSGTGTVTIVATKAQDDRYFATATTNTVVLVAAKAVQAITFANPGAQLTTDATPIAATASSGLPVMLEVISGSATLSTNISPATLTYSGAGQVSVVATQAGDANWLAAGKTNTFVVHLPVQPVVTTPVHRFWSDSLRSHFYTASEDEKNHVIATWSDVWRYEGLAFYAHGGAVENSKPVYRFWSDRINGHLYTISEADKATLEGRFSNVFRYEGHAWHAFDYQAPGTLPVYRFRAQRTRRIFFTISETERETVIATMSDIWREDGIAWYAYPTEQFGQLIGQQITTALQEQDAAPAALQAAGAGATVVGQSGAAGVEVVFSLSYGRDTVVEATLYDPLTNGFTQVLEPTVAPAELVIPSLAFGQRYWLSVLSRDIGEASATLDYGGWLGRAADRPLEEIVTVEDGDGMPIGLPVEMIILPASEGPLSLLLYEPEGDQLLQTLTGLKGGTTFALTVPAWNRWYLVGIEDETSCVLLDTFWIGHLRTH